MFILGLLPGPSPSSAPVEDPPELSFGVRGQIQHVTVASVDNDLEPVGRGHGSYRCQVVVGATLPQLCPASRFSVARVVN
ncbi:hypothetical protein TREES_T100010484 [Tupaia chinensis]|uniref:Uncharacterized protein n=1 Tax=Tupaia chinensis TaxID=246437 RepID=L9LAV5_TUPCH|nr:hypothetical protein TREES_T100010484 [Tupaia chinensis]